MKHPVYTALDELLQVRYNTNIIFSFISNFNVRRVQLLKNAIPITFRYNIYVYTSYMLQRRLLVK